MEDSLALFREPLDSVHDFFKGRCTARNDASDPFQKSRLVSYNGSKYFFHIHTGLQSIPLEIPKKLAAYKAKGYELIDRMISNPVKKLNSIEEDTLAYFESVYPFITDTKQINLEIWKGKNNLEELSAVLLTEDEKNAGIGIGIIVDCGMKPRFSEHFETIEKPIQGAKVRYYNLHLMCTDWDEAPKTSKNVYKADIVVKPGIETNEKKIFGCGVSFQFKSLDTLAEEVGMYAGELNLEHLNINNIKVELPSYTDLNFKVTLPHSLLKTKSLKLTVPHMCNSVYQGVLKGSFYDPNKFQKNFVKSKHEYISTIRNSAEKLGQNMFTDDNLQRNNLFFNLKRSMDAGQVEVTHWLNRNIGKYSLVITEALDSKSKKVHSLCAAKSKILDPKTLHDMIIKKEMKIAREDIEKAIIDPGTPNSSKLIPRLDKFVLFTCDRLCYLKAKLMKVPSVYVNATLNQIRVFQGITKSRDEIFVETVRSLYRFFYEENADFATTKNNFVVQVEQPLEIEIDPMFKPLYDDIDRLERYPFVSTVIENRNAFNSLLSELQSHGVVADAIELYDSPGRLRFQIENLKHMASMAFEQFSVLSEQIIQGLPDNVTELTPFMGLVGDGIDQSTFDRFLNVLRDYYLDTEDNKVHVDWTEAIPLLKMVTDVEFFYTYLASIKKIQRYLQLVLGYRPLVATYPNDLATVSLAQEGQPNIIDVSYDLTCNFEPSKAKKKFIYKLPRFNQVILHIAQNMNIPIMDILECIFNIYSIEFPDSDIPRGCVNVNSGIDCIRALQKIFLTFNMRNRSTRAEFEKAILLTGLIERTMTQNIDVLVELIEEIGSKANFMSGGTRTRQMPTFHRRMPEVSREMWKGRDEQALAPREAMLTERRMTIPELIVPETISLQDASIETIQAIDKFIKNVVEVFNVSPQVLMLNVNSALSKFENRLQLMPPQNTLSRYDFYHQVCFGHPTTSVMRLLNVVTNSLKNHILLDKDRMRQNQNIAEVCKIVLNRLSITYSVTPDERTIAHFFNAVTALFINLHSNPNHHYLFDVFSGNENPEIWQQSTVDFEFLERENEYVTFTIYLACTLAYSLASSVSLSLEDVTKDAIHNFYLLHEDPILRYLLCREIYANVHNTQHAGMNVTKTKEIPFNSLKDYHKKYYPTYARLYYDE